MRVIKNVEMKDVPVALGVYKNEAGEPLVTVGDYVLGTVNWLKEMLDTHTANNKKSST